jgi:acetyl-CoA/propionyl-CoA carboxylase biotin carboxyl carrier protein
VWVARCVHAIDLGTQTVTFAGDSKLQHKILLSWEVFGEDEAGVPLTVEVNGKRFAVKAWVPAGTSAPTTRNRAAATVPAKKHGSGSGQITVPMQGTVVKLMVAIGDTVDVGQSLLILEAMKMENHISADKSGTVAEVRVAAGQTVGAGDIVVVIN